MHKNVDIQADYRPGVKTISPVHGMVDTSSLVLKLYQMHELGKPFHSDFTALSQEFLITEINEERITPELGLGFAILSEDTLNVARWGKETPYVLVNQVYGFENQDVLNAQRINMEKDGAFCGFELKIVGYETSLWGGFLYSQKKEEDIQKYLSTFAPDGPLTLD